MFKTLLLLLQVLKVLLQEIDKKNKTTFVFTIHFKTVFASPVFD